MTCRDAGTWCRVDSSCPFSSCFAHSSVQTQEVSSVSRSIDSAVRLLWVVVLNAAEGWKYGLRCGIAVRLEDSHAGVSLALCTGSVTYSRTEQNTSGYRDTDVSRHPPRCFLHRSNMPSVSVWTVYIYILPFKIQGKDSSTIRMYHNCNKPHITI